MSITSPNTGSVSTGCTDTVAFGLPTLGTDTLPLLPKKAAEPVGKLANGRTRAGERLHKGGAPAVPVDIPGIRTWTLRDAKLIRVPAERHVAGMRPVHPTLGSYEAASASNCGRATAEPQQRLRRELPPWPYEEAFARNRGLISPNEQHKLRNSHVAIVGLGGVGGVHLITLARLGIGRFTIADPDVFETANFNRQAGATVDTIGRGKAEVMAQQARAINPELNELNLRVFNNAVTPDNVADFLSGVDVLIDGVDFFNIEARRLVFREAARRGIWAVTAGPIGFSTAWLVFDPHGMSFDDYFDLHDQMDRLDQLIAFAVGLTPRATHLRYMNLREVDVKAASGPSASLACHGASMVAAAEVLRILLGRGQMRPAPWYFQFDAYRQVLRKGRVRWGNRHPWQRLKRYVLRRHIRNILKQKESGVTQ